MRLSIGRQREMNDSTRPHGNMRKGLGDMGKAATGKLSRSQRIEGGRMNNTSRKKGRAGMHRSSGG